MSGWSARNAAPGSAACRARGSPACGAARSTTRPGCIRPGTSGPAASRPGSRSRTATRSSRANRPDAGLRPREKPDAAPDPTFSEARGVARRRSPARPGIARRTAAKPPLRLGFFTRLLDQADAAERYRLALAQIAHAERCGYDSAWVAQHHFHEDEGGLPAPFVFLSQAASRTTRIRLGTGIVCLPLELPIRVAEDAAVLDLMCGGRLEVGIGPGGNLSAYTAFGLDSDERTALLVGYHRTLIDAWTGRELPGGDRLYPPDPGLADRVWQATFNVEGARRAGAAGDGLMLSRTQPRPREAPGLSLPDIQNPMIDAYLEALPQEAPGRGRAPRILASRSASSPTTATRRCDGPNSVWRERGHATPRSAARCLSRACRYTIRSPRWISISATRTT